MDLGAVRKSMLDLNHVGDMTLRAVHEGRDSIGKGTFYGLSIPMPNRIARFSPFLPPEGGEPG